MDNNYAIAHMIGQLEQVEKSASANDVAVWMGVSKTTAIARLKWMATVGLVNITIKPHRTNAVKMEISLTEKSRTRYKNGGLLRYYNDWIAKRNHVERIRVGSTKAMFV